MKSTGICYAQGTQLGVVLTTAEYNAQMEAYTTLTHNDLNLKHQELVKYSIAASNLIESLRSESSMVASCCKWIKDVLEPVKTSLKAAKDTGAAKDAPTAKDPPTATDTTAAGTTASTPSHDTAGVANLTSKETAALTDMKAKEVAKSPMTAEKLVPMVPLNNKTYAVPNFLISELLDKHKCLCAKCSLSIKPFWSKRLEDAQRKTTGTILPSVLSQM